MPPNPVSGREKFKKRLLAKTFVRFHMSLILMGTIGAGVLTSRLLLSMGIGAIMFRYALDVAGAYLVFLLLVRLWLWYVHSQTVPSDTLDILADEAEFPSLNFSSGTSSGGGSSGGGSWLPDLNIDIDGEGLLIIILFAILVIGIVLAGGYLIWMAPEILGEAAFDVLVAGGLTGVINRLEKQGWIVGVVRGTILPFLIIFALTMALAYGIHSICPNAATLREGLTCPEPK